MKRIIRFSFSNCIVVFALVTFSHLSAQDIGRLTESIVFLEDFEIDNIARLGKKQMLSVDFKNNNYCEGKFGRGYFFERPRHNYFPKSIANPERRKECFIKIGNSTLDIKATQTEFGNNSLSILMPQKGSGFETKPVKILFNRQRASSKTVTLIASCYVKGTKGEKFTIVLKMQPAKLGNDVKTLLLTDKEFPQSIVLDEGWQRIACYVEGDSRLKNRKAVFSLVSGSDKPVTIFVDGFQLEQVNFYPFHHLVPTTWTIGNAECASTAITIDAPSLSKKFPVNEGSICFWTKTPHTSNLRINGGCDWVEFGVGWQHPAWTLSTYRFHAGPQDKFCYFTSTNAQDGKWHYITMTWKDNRATAYLDGKKFRSFERSNLDISNELGQFKLMLGGSIRSRKRANCIMDEIVIFNKELSAEDIKALASLKNPLSTYINTGILFSVPLRTVFFRNEENASIEIELMSLKKNKRQQKESPHGVLNISKKQYSHEVAISLDDLYKSNKKILLRQGGGKIIFKFKPYIFKCGNYNCKITATDQSGIKNEFIFPVNILPAISKDIFNVSTWGQGAETGDWRRFCKIVGINTVDSPSFNMEELAKDGFLFNWHYRSSSYYKCNGNWSPEDRLTIKTETRKAAKKIAPFFNWISIIINSEKSSFPTKKEQAEWFDKWAQNELGFKIPEKNWKLIVKGPVRCWFSKNEKPGKDGVFTPNRAFKFLEWYYSRGLTWWRINATVAKAVKDVRKDIVTWTDPLQFSGQIVDLDAGSNWAYDSGGKERGLEHIIMNLMSSYSIAKLYNKPFFSTLGMVYVSQHKWMTVIDKGGKKIKLAPVLDNLSRQAWVAAVAIPSERINYWCMDGVFYGLKNKKGYYCPPDTDKKFGEIIKTQIIPLGVMLKGADLVRPPVALLLPYSTAWVNAGEGGWRWEVESYKNIWQRELLNNDISYDIIFDKNATPENLSKYKYVIFPMAEYVSEKIYNSLVKVGQSGVRIITDRHCRQKYPNMDKWDIGYTNRLPWQIREANKKSFNSLVSNFKERLKKDLYVWTDAQKGTVFTFT